MIALARHAPSLVGPALRQAERSIAKGDHLAILDGGTMTEEERARLREPDAREVLAALFGEGLRNGVAAHALDTRLWANDWGVDLGAITAPTALFYGSRDPYQPPAVGEWLKDRIEGATLEVLDLPHLVTPELAERAFERAIR